MMVGVIQIFIILFVTDGLIKIIEILYNNH
jgi:hypothetical protein